MNGEITMGKLTIYAKNQLFPVTIKTGEDEEDVSGDSYTRKLTKGSSYIMDMIEDKENGAIRITFIREADGTKIKKEYAHWSYSIPLANIELYQTEAYTPEAGKRGFSKINIFLK